MCKIQYISNITYYTHLDALEGLEVLVGLGVELGELLGEVGTHV